MRPKPRKVSEHGDTIIFRGKRYWFYRDEFVKSIKPIVRKLMKAGYKVRLVRSRVEGSILNIYTAPKIPFYPERRLRFG